MSDLKAKLLRAVAFDEEGASTYGEDKHDYVNYHIDESNCPTIHENTAFTLGAQYENARLQPLLTALIECVETAEAARLTTEGTPFYDDKLSQALLALQTLLKGDT